MLQYSDLDIVTQVGDEIQCRCNFCPERIGRADHKGHLNVNIVKGLYHCFLCGAGGHLGSYEARPTKRYFKPAVQFVEYTELPEHCYHVFSLTDDPNVAAYLDKAGAYLKSRHISIEQAWEYDLRVCTQGFYQNRLIIPVVMFNKLVYYIARTLDPAEKLRYLNPKGMQRKGKVHNFDRAVKYCNETAKPLVVCEGVFSAMRVGPQAVATFGKSMDRVQAALLASTGLPIVILYDTFAENDALTAADNLYSWGAKVRIAWCPEADPKWTSDADKGKAADPGCCSPEALQIAIVNAYEFKRITNLEKMRCR